MEQRREKLSEFDRFHIIQLLKKNNIDLNKKRKLQPDELGLPKQRQKCYDQSCPSQPLSKFDSGMEAAGKAHLESESEPDSAKDSNIRGQDSDSISMFLEPEKNSDFSMDSINVMGSSSSKERDNIHQQNNETEEDRLEQSITDEELEELLYSYGLNPNRYPISSPTWTIHQEAQAGPRKATIDQEFEHYFSMLNL